MLKLPPKISLTSKHYKAIQWCINNDIYVSALPTKRGTKIEIVNKNKRKVSPKTYKKVDLHKKIWELYLYLYKKYS